MLPSPRSATLGQASTVKPWQIQMFRIRDITELIAHSHLVPICGISPRLPLHKKYGFGLFEFNSRGHARCKYRSRSYRRCERVTNSTWVNSYVSDHLNGIYRALNASSSGHSQPIYLRDRTSRKDCYSRAVKSRCELPCYSTLWCDECDYQPLLGSVLVTPQTWHQGKLDPIQWITRNYTDSSNSTLWAGHSALLHIFKC